MQHTWYAMLSTFAKLTAVSAFLVGCVSSPDPETLTRKVSGPQIKNFNEKYETIWKATLQTMGKFPLKTYDQESGVIETDFIRGDNVWTPPYKKKYVSGGYRYKINVKLIKIRPKTDAATRVIILKQPELQRDFFSTPEKVPTDGLEESALLYRIEREVAIQNLLEKYKK